MMKSPHAIAMVIAVFAVAACDRAPVVADAPAPTAPHAAADQDPTGGLAPPLLVPGENTVPSEPPSYEVSIASVAADHNKALERCARQPQSVRTQCEQEANAAFADAEKNLEPLRGNQE